MVRSLVWMPILRTAGVAVVTAAATFGGIVNGGFESGSLTGWTVEYGPVKWTGPCSATVAWSTLPPPAGCPLAAVIGSVSAIALNQPIDVDPYCGRFCARINELLGGPAPGLRATRLRQSFIVSANESCPLPNAQHVKLTWGAMLQNGNHCTAGDTQRQAEVSIEVKVNNTSASLTEIDATQAASPGS